MVNCDQQTPFAIGRGVRRARVMDPRRLEARDVAKLLIVSVVTARRRLSSWYRATEASKSNGTPPDAPHTQLCSDFLRRGRSSYFTTRAELAKYYPEINDG